ncbi:MAG: HAD-IA family hydrolase [Clostridium sp.]|uniref:HAD family hydrolase n=1 Tax=Butyribacter sp. TaxID=2822465 RepID=UPI002A9E00A0|nr:HAD-IA family hydrolase [Clostridium sp.]MDY5180228.1 HAD-IA family hydrolase [Butyribacter sp.]
MRYKLAVFDMDGTILNTLEDLADSTNYALKANGFPERTIDEVRRFVGNGIRLLIERAVPTDTDKELTDKVFDTFKEYYKTHCAVKTRPYDGIKDVLSELRKAGCLTAVVSNKADFAVQDLCKDYFDNLFDFAIGEREGIKKKPAPDSVFEVLSKLNVEKADAVYIGDSDVDFATSMNAGMDVIMVGWGFRDAEFLREKGVKRIIKQPSEILDIILEK